MHLITPAERSEIAKRIGVHEQYLYQCLSGRRQTPADRCPAIERATEGKVTCDELRPDVRWHRIVDSDWPHPLGRPCIDVAGDPQIPAPLIPPPPAAPRAAEVQP